MNSIVAVERLRRALARRQAAIDVDEFIAILVEATEQNGALTEVEQGPHAESACPIAPEAD